MLCLGDPVYIVKMMSSLEDFNQLSRGLDLFFQYMILAQRLLILGYDAKHNIEKVINKQFLLQVAGKELEAMEGYFSKEAKWWVGYPMCFKAILTHNVEDFYKGFKVMMEHHKILASNWFRAEDSRIALWPLGVVNLARMKGLDVKPKHPLIPQDLIVKELGGL